MVKNGSRGMVVRKRKGGNKRVMLNDHKLRAVPEFQAQATDHIGSQFGFCRFEKYPEIKKELWSGEFCEDF